MEQKYTADEMEVALRLVALTTMQGTKAPTTIAQIDAENRHRGDDVKRHIRLVTKFRRAALEQIQETSPRAGNQGACTLLQVKKSIIQEQELTVNRIEVQEGILKDGDGEADSPPDSGDTIEQERGQTATQLEACKQCAETTEHQENQQAMKDTRQKQERFKANLQAQIEKQERGSGMKVANFSGSSHGKGRRDGQGGCQQRHSPQRTLLDNNNDEIFNSVEVADDATVSDNATISDANTDDGTIICPNCEFSVTELVSLNPCPVCCLNSMMKAKKAKSKRRRSSSDGEKQAEQAAKRLATGQEHPSTPRTVTKIVRDSHARPTAEHKDAIPPRPLRTKANTTNGNLKPTEYNPLEVFAPPSTAQPMLPLSRVRELRRTNRVLRFGGKKPSPTAVLTPEVASPEGLTPSLSSQNGKHTVKNINQGPKASIDLPSGAKAVSNADITALGTRSRSSRIDAATIANESTRLGLIRDLLGATPDLLVEPSNHGAPAGMPEEISDKDLSSDEEEDSSAPASKKVYDYPPPFDPEYDEKALKKLARREYASEEDILGLEDSDNDVPDEHNPGKTRRRIADTPEDDYPEPVGGGDMRLRPEENVYWGAISRKIKTQTPQEYLDDRTATIWRLEIARMRERHAEFERAKANKVDDQAGFGNKSPVKQQGGGTGASPLRK